MDKIFVYSYIMNTAALIFAGVVFVLNYLKIKAIHFVYQLSKRPEDDLLCGFSKRCNASSALVDPKSNLGLCLWVMAGACLILLLTFAVSFTGQNLVGGAVPDYIYGLIGVLTMVVSSGAGVVAYSLYEVYKDDIRDYNEKNGLFARLLENNNIMSEANASEEPRAGKVTTGEVEWIRNQYFKGHAVKTNRIFVHGATLRKPGVDFQLTDEEAVEMERCAADPVYFAEKYCKVKSGGVFHDVTLTDKHKTLLNSTDRFVAAIQDRQMGVSTAMVIKHLHSTLFKRRFIGVYSMHRKYSNELVNRFKEMYEQLPYFMQKGVVKWTMEHVVLEDGSGIKSVGNASFALGLSMPVDADILVDPYLFPAVVDDKDDFLDAGWLKSEKKEEREFYEVWKAIEGVVGLHNGQVVANDTYANAGRFTGTRYNPVWFLNEATREPLG